MTLEAASDPALLLVCRAGAIRCALPVQHLVETMRPLPLFDMPGAPDFVAGISIVRGVPLPIVSVDRLFDEPDAGISRVVIVRAGQRRLGLAFDEVNGFRTLQRETVGPLPLLLAMASATAMAQIAVLDGELLAILSTVSIVPEAVFSTLAAMVKP